MTHVSLFTGIGGLDLAAEMHGFQTRLMCERDPKCRLVLAARWPNVLVVEDVYDLTGDLVRDACGGAPTVVSGGFPCQPFSSAGRRRGTDDERHLWPQMRRVVRESRPRWVVAENVRGLLSIGDGSVFGAVVADLADLGYRVGWCCFGADEATGSPHRRDRVFIVGYLADGGHGAGRAEHRLELEARRSRPGKPGVSVADGGVEDAGRGGGRRVGTVRDGPGVPGERPAHPIPTSRSGGAMADGYRNGLECERGRAWREPRGDDIGHGEGFPPGPGDLAGWRAVAMSDPSRLPALSAEAEVELQVRPSTDGLSRRMALKMLGNAVVPAQAGPIFGWIARHERGGE